MRTELGRSQVEVQQCALSSEVGQELGRPRVGKFHVEAEVVEEEDAEEEEEGGGGEGGGRGGGGGGG